MGSGKWERGGWESEPPRREGRQRGRDGNREVGVFVPEGRVILAGLALAPGIGGKTMALSRCDNPIGSAQLLDFEPVVIQAAQTPERSRCDEECSGTASPGVERPRLGTVLLGRRPPLRRKTTSRR